MTIQPVAPTAADTVVVIDDDATMRLACRQILSRMGFGVEVFEDGAHGLAAIPIIKPALLVVDLKMPGIGGLEVVSRVHEIDPAIVIVVITGYATISTAVDAMKAGAYDFLPKPFAADELRMIVNRGMERRRLQAEAQQFQVERELLRRRFVSFVSHQLQSPLVAVHQYLDVLRRMGDGPDIAAKRDQWLDRCLRRTEELQGLIRDWLTIAQVDGGTLIGARTRIDVNTLVPTVIAANEQLAAQNGVTLSAQLDARAAPVLGDRSGLNVLLDNLIVNGIKYNRANGHVTVGVSRGNGEVVITVKDTGVGIPEKYRTVIFEEFFRIKENGGPQSSGTGLGLPICKRIAAELGGTIEVESRENVGSIFRIRLPLHVSSAEKQGDAA